MSERSVSDTRRAWLLARAVRLRPDSTRAIVFRVSSRLHTAAALGLPEPTRITATLGVLQDVLESKVRTTRTLGRSVSSSPAAD